MAASNTRECFSECVGRRIIGVLFHALPVGRRDLAAGTKTLVFDDGTGLTFTGNGAYWQEPADEIARAVAERRRALDAAKNEIADVLALAGALAERGEGGTQK